VRGAKNSPGGAKTTGQVTKERRAGETRAQLIGSARRLFGQRGYDAVSLSEIVAASGLTKGALYHHFPDGKRALFEAVFVQVEAESTAKAAAQVLAAGPAQVDVVAAMKIASSEFLSLSLDPELQRISLIDAPAVLGWERWREIAAEHGLGVIEASLSAAIEAGQIGPRPVKPLAHMLMAALSESAMLVAGAEDQEAARIEVEGALFAVLDGLATTP